MPEREDRRRLLPLLREFWAESAERHFEGLFILVVLLSVGALGSFVEDKLAFLNFFFIPVLLAGYFLSVRSAVLGSLLSILWVGLFVVVSPRSFYVEPSPLGLALHLVAWGSFLLLCGVLVGRLNEQLLEKLSRLRFVLEEWKKTQAELDFSHKDVQDKAQGLEALRTRLESVLYGSVDSVTAHLAIQERLESGRRAITVLCADFVDFTRIAEGSEPEAFLAQLNALCEQIEPIIAAHHGRVDKFESRGILAEFGIPVSTPRNAALAVLAALRIQRQAAGRRFPWKMRIGIAHGPALVGLVGSRHRRSYTALGGVVNLAVKLQEICPPGGVCVDAHTQQGIGPAFRTRRLFTGRSPEPPESLEGQLRVLKRHLKSVPPSLDATLEAGRLCSELGLASEAVAYYEKALELDPGSRERIEGCMAEMRFEQEANRHVAVKGEVHPLAVFEVLALRDPCEDEERIPPALQALAERLFKERVVNPEALLPLEALRGTIGHSRVSAVLSFALAEALGLPEESQRAAFLAGFYHDAGLRGLPPSMAGKEEGTLLQGRERSLMESHPEGARAVLSDLGLELPEEAIAAIAQHHENWDGSGYPAGLKGVRISIIARLLRIADAYEGLTAWRPSREALAPAQALSELGRQALAGELDPKIFEAFRRLLSGIPPA